MRARWIAALALALACWVGPATAAVTWNVVTNNDCTGQFAATGLTSAIVDCCNASAAGGGNVCEEKPNMGAYFFRFVTFAVGAGGAYTANGDALTAANIAKIGLNTIVGSSCQETVGTAASATGGQVVMWVPTVAPAGAPWGATIRLNQTGSGGTTPVTSGGQYVGNIANVTFNCTLWGR